MKVVEHEVASLEDWLFVEDLLRGAAPMLTLLFITAVNNAAAFYLAFAGSWFPR